MWKSAPEDESLTYERKSALIALLEAGQSSARYGGEGWTKAIALAVAKEVRSAKAIRSLIDLGYVDARKVPPGKQGQWLYRITIGGQLEAEKASASSRS